MFLESPFPSFVPLSAPPRQFLRQYGSVPPVLAADNVPVISAVAGLGTGGGASAFSPSNGAFGYVDVFAGEGYDAAGSVALTFPSAPATMFISGDEAFGALTQAVDGNVIAISWANASFVPRSAPYRINFQWATSR